MDLAEYLRTHQPQGFKPVAYYGTIGDMVTWYWSEGSGAAGYAEPVMADGVHVGSVIRDMKTKEPIGVKINNIKKMVQNSERT